jgi:hypothetical protein
MTLDLPDPRFEPIFKETEPHEGSEDAGLHSERFDPVDGTAAMALV